jgi:hypothetical protein
MKSVPVIRWSSSTRVSSKSVFVIHVNFTYDGMEFCYKQCYESVKSGVNNKFFKYVTITLHLCDKCVTSVWQVCDKSVTGVLQQDGYKCLGSVSQVCYTCVQRVLWTFVLLTSPSRFIFIDTSVTCVVMLQHILQHISQWRYGGVTVMCHLYCYGVTVESQKCHNYAVCISHTTLQIHHPPSTIWRYSGVKAVLQRRRNRFAKASQRY